MHLVVSLSVNQFLILDPLQQTTGNNINTKLWSKITKLYLELVRCQISRKLSNQSLITIHKLIFFCDCLQQQDRPYS